MGCLVGGAFCTAHTKRGFWDNLEALILNRHPTVRAKAILTFLNPLKCKIDSRDVFIRMGKCLLATLLENSQLRLTSTIQNDLLAFQKILIQYFPLRNYETYIIAHNTIYVNEYNTACFLVFLRLSRILIIVPRAVSSAGRVRNG